MDEPIYIWDCQKCGKEQSEDQREFVWKPQYVSICEDCYCELCRTEK
jgi:hypothetical protein